MFSLNFDSGVASNWYRVMSVSFDENWATYPCAPRGNDILLVCHTVWLGSILPEVVKTWVPSIVTFIVGLPKYSISND